MDMRGASRIAISRMVTCRVPATPVTVALHDISTAGCACSCESALPKYGVTILISLNKNLQVSGQVAWAKKGRFGVQFHRTLTDEQVIEAAANEKLIQAELIDAIDEIGRDQFGRALPPLKHSFRKRDG